jgi:hypothetical protein
VCSAMFGHVCEGSYMFICVHGGHRASSSVPLTVLVCQFLLNATWDLSPQKQMQCGQH